MGRRHGRKRRQPEQLNWDLGGRPVNYLVTVVMKDGRKYERIRQGTSAYAVMKEIEIKLSQWSRKTEVSGFYVDPVPQTPNNIG
jgi:hypothetical protein